MNCDYCERKAETESELRTHILLKHREKADPEEYEAEVSDGFLNTESRAEKGEQFGYE